MTRRFDLVAFDVDGTLVTHPRDKTVWEVLNRRFIGDDTVNRERYALYRAGELSYADWVTLDVQGWIDAGARRGTMLEALGPLKLVPGVRETLDALKRGGACLVVVSGTVDLLLDLLLPDHPFDEIHANRVLFDERGEISGWEATPFDMDGKATALREIAGRKGIPLERCAFVGDGTNDLWIARIAGRSVAFLPKCEQLEAEADAVVRSGDLRDVLEYLL